MKKRTFTLVELLIVIGIIIILSGILLPVLVGAGKKADQTKAKAEITTLVNAIKQFESTYGVLPVPGVDAASQAQYSWKKGKQKEHKELDGDAYRWLIKVLQAQTLTSTEETRYGKFDDVNPRKQKFLDIVGNTPGEYLDPWDEIYKVHLDSDYNGEIQPDLATMPRTPIQGTSAPKFYFSIVVWSKGPDKKADNTANDKSNRDNVYSFSTSWSKATGHTIER